MARDPHYTGLPYGERTKLEQNQQVADQEAAQHPQDQQLPDNYFAAKSSPVGGNPPNFTPQNEDQKLLFAPTDRMDESVTQGVQQFHPMPPPEGVADWLPAIRQAAAQPDAPATVKALLRVLTYHLEKAGLQGQ